MARSKSHSSQHNQVYQQLNQQQSKQQLASRTHSPSARLSMAMIVVILVNSLMIQAALGQLTFSKSWVAGGGKRSSAPSALLDDLVSGNLAYPNVESPLQYQLQLLQASPDDGIYELLLKHKALSDLLSITWKTLLKDDHCYRLLVPWHNGQSAASAKMARAKRSA